MTLRLDRLKRSRSNAGWTNSTLRHAVAGPSRPSRAESFLFLVDRFKRSRSNALKPPNGGVMEAYEHNLPKDAPLRPLFLANKQGQAKPDWTFNMLLKHGVRSCLEYAKNFDLKRAGRSPTRIWLRTSSSSIWEDTDMRRSDCRPMRCGPSLSASRALLRGAKNRTAGPSGIGSRTTRSCGRKARSPFWFNGSWKETLTCAFNRSSVLAAAVGQFRAGLLRIVAVSASSSASSPSPTMSKCLDATPNLINSLYSKAEVELQVNLVWRSTFNLKGIQTTLSP